MSDENDLNEASDFTDVPSMLDDLIEASKDLGRQEAMRTAADNKCRKFKAEVGNLRSRIANAVSDLECLASLAEEEEDPDMPPDNAEGVQVEIPPAAEEKKHKKHKK